MKQFIKVKINPKQSAGSGATSTNGYLHVSSIVGFRTNGDTLNVIVKPEYLPSLQETFFGQVAKIDSITTDTKEIE
jgi:hypothetical protein